MSEQEQKLDLPEWARWITRNTFGQLVAHQEKPVKNKYCGAWYSPAGTKSATLESKEWEKYLRYVTWDLEEPTPITKSKNVMVVGSDAYPNFSAVVSDENKALKKVRTWMHEAAEAAFENSKMPDDSNRSIYTPVTQTPDPKIALHKQITEELTAIYEAKNHDYGDSFQETYRKLGLISAVTRISDKVNRLQSLSKKEQRVAEESIRDTLMDCANYCIMTIIALEGEE